MVMRSVSYEFGLGLIFSFAGSGFEDNGNILVCGLVVSAFDFAFALQIYYWAERARGRHVTHAGKPYVKNNTYNEVRSFAVSHEAHLVCFVVFYVPHCLLFRSVFGATVHTMACG